MRQTSPTKMNKETRIDLRFLAALASMLARKPFLSNLHSFLEFGAKSGKKSSKIRIKNAKFEVFAIELMNIH